MNNNAFTQEQQAIFEKVEKGKYYINNSTSNLNINKENIEDTILNLLHYRFSRMIENNKINNVFIPFTENTDELIFYMNLHALLLNCDHISQYTLDDLEKKYKKQVAKEWICANLVPFE